MLERLALACGSCLVADINSSRANDAGEPQGTVCRSRQFKVGYFEFRVGKSNPKNGKNKSKNRNQASRQDRVEKRDLVRRKSIVFNILGIKKIYRYSRESREVS